MTLTEFLLARIADDERAAQTDKGEETRTYYSTLGSQQDDWGVWFHNVPPVRMLAECEAKRRVVSVEPISQGAAMMHAHILGILALPYADHPEYQQEWKL